MLHAFIRQQKLIWNGSEVTEEFQETEYYKDLNRINKDHHTVQLSLSNFIFHFATLATVKSYTEPNHNLPRALDLPSLIQIIKSSKYFRPKKKKKNLHNTVLKMKKKMLRLEHDSS